MTDVETQPAAVEEDDEVRDSYAHTLYPDVMPLLTLCGMVMQLDSPRIVLDPVRLEPVPSVPSLRSHQGSTMTAVETPQPASAGPEELLLAFQETADFIGLPVSTLRLLAALRVGPRHFKLGGRDVYRTTDLDVWCKRLAEQDGDELKTAVTHVIETYRQIERRLFG